MSQQPAGTPRRGGGGQSPDNKKELDVLAYVYEHTGLRETPAAVAKVIDTYKTEKAGLMTIGPEKAKYIVDGLAKLPPGPKTFLEFGAYVGYSAVVLASALVEANKGHPVKYYSLEVNPVNAAITTSFAELAGLKDVVQVYVGPAADTLRQLVKEGVLKPGQVDSMLLDHWKFFYLPDLKVVEELGLLRVGSVIFADNCGPARMKPEERGDRGEGIIEYVDYVMKGVPANAEGFVYKSELVDFTRDAICFSEVVTA